MSARSAYPGLLGARRALLFLSVFAVSGRGSDQPAPRPHEGCPPPDTYSVQVLEEETNFPVPGVAVIIHERSYRTTCVDENCRLGCSTTMEQERTRGCLTDARGIASATFDYWICENRSGELYETVMPAGPRWGEVVECLTSETYHHTIFSRSAPGSGGVNQILYVTREETLARRFAPVLHKHPLDLQEDLADINLSVRAPGTVLRGFNAAGAQVVSRTNNTDLHVLYQQCGDADSYSEGGTVQIQWQMDLDDNVRYQGAPVGSRPLYYHVFPWPDGGAVIQYWSWHNMNDLRQLPGVGCYHEGDWECSAIKASFDGTFWAPEWVNFYRHLGGITMSPASCWWSATNDPSYLGLEQGCTPYRTHLHVYVGANSHAAYNRWEPQYRVTVMGVDCYTDVVDYNITDQPQGMHRFFAYDRLVNMGEFQSAGTEHGCHWLHGHYSGPLCLPPESDVLRFSGWFGHRDCPEDIPEIVCSSLLGFPSLYTGVKSPIEYQGNHEWRGFTVNTDGWGNPPGVTAPPRGDYLGRFMMCPNGSHERITFRVPSVAGTSFARVGIRRVVGDVRFLGADSYGHIFLPRQSDGTFLFDQGRVDGEGMVEIEIVENPDAGEPDVCATGLTAEIIQWGPAQIEQNPEPMGDRVRVFPSVGSGPVRISYSHCAGANVICEVMDAGGRLVDRLERRCADGAGELVWNAVDRPAGFYFIRFWDGRSWLRGGKTIVVR